jgi:hypothetical protein
MNKSDFLTPTTWNNTQKSSYFALCTETVDKRPSEARVVSASGNRATEVHTHLSDNWSTWLQYKCDF